jgi:hypothetical protein
MGGALMGLTFEEWYVKRPRYKRYEHKARNNLFIIKKWLLFTSRLNGASLLFIDDKLST